MVSYGFVVALTELSIAGDCVTLVLITELGATVSEGSNVDT